MAPIRILKDWDLFMNAGCIDAVTLAAECPKIAQDIRAGHLSERDLLNNLIICDLFCLPLKGDPQRRRRDWTRVLLHNLALLVFDKFENKSDEEIESMRDQFYRELMSFRMPTLEELEQGGSLKTLLYAMQQHFDQTVEQWQDRFPENYLDTCKGKCYKITRNEFHLLVLMILDQNDLDVSQMKGDNHVNIEASKSKGTDLEYAFKGIVEGHDVFESTCWECGVTKNEKIQRCSSCQVARYCSKECQTESWKGGHKKVCKKLKATFARFNQDLELVESQQGVPTKNPFVDYDILFRIVESNLNGWTSIHHRVWSRNRPVPSMKSYYTNLAAIANDYSKWPFFFRGTNEARLPGDYDGPNDFITACYYLAYDIPVFVKIPNALNPEYFLQIYAESDEFLHKDRAGRDPMAAKSWCVGRVTKMLKEKYNKAE